LLRNRGGRIFILLSRGMGKYIENTIEVFYWYIYVALASKMPLA